MHGDADASFPGDSKVFFGTLQRGKISSDFSYVLYVFPLCRVTSTNFGGESATMTLPSHFRLRERLLFVL